MRENSAHMVKVYSTSEQCVCTHVCYKLPWWWWWWNGKKR